MKYYTATKKTQLVIHTDRCRDEAQKHKAEGEKPDARGSGRGEPPTAAERSPGWMHLSKLSGLRNHNRCI